MLRSVLAVTTGFFYIGALSYATDALVRRLIPAAFGAGGRVEHAGVLLLLQAGVALAAVSGCYLAARWAGRAPMRHALALGGLGLLFNVAGTVAMWESAPAWYHALALLLVMPYAYAGGRLREREVARAAASRRVLARPAL